VRQGEVGKRTGGEGKDWRRERSGNRLLPSPSPSLLYPPSPNTI